MVTEFFPPLSALRVTFPGHLKRQENSTYIDHGFLFSLVALRLEAQFFWKKKIGDWYDCRLDMDMSVRLGHFLRVLCQELALYCSSPALQSLYYSLRKWGHISRFPNVEAAVFSVAMGIIMMVCLCCLERPGRLLVV